MPKLQSVSAELPDPPYPADTKANGWKPEIDIQRVDSSDTWTLADDEQRPWLLRIWYESWRSVPVGSMPKDRRIFARRIGCKPEFLEANAEILLRGWILHTDERLYHEYVVSQVLDMLGTRHNAAARQRRLREKKKPNKINKTEQMSRVTHGESHGSHVQEQEQEQEQDPSPPISPPSDSSRFSLSPTENTLPATPAFSLPPEVDRQTWEKFEAHRLVLHKTDKKRNPLLNDLSRAEAAEILRKLPREQQRTVVQASIVSGWKGLFPDSKPKDGRKEKNNLVRDTPTRARLTAL